MGGRGDPESAGERSLSHFEEEVFSSLTSSARESVRERRTATPRNSSFKYRPPETPRPPETTPETRIAPRRYSPSRWRATVAR